MCLKPNTNEITKHTGIQFKTQTMRDGSAEEENKLMEN